MNVYIKAEDSVCLNHKEVRLKDIITLYCTDKDLEMAVKNKSVYHFQDDENQRKCFSILKVIEEIKKIDKTLDIVNLGSQDFIVYTKKRRKSQRSFIMERLFL